MQKLFDDGPKTSATAYCSHCGTENFGNSVRCKNCLELIGRERIQQVDPSQLPGILQRIIIIIVWAGSALSSVGAGVILVAGFATANGAPQEAVVAALACAVAILPYCFARAVTEAMRLLTRQ